MGSSSIRLACAALLGCLALPHPASACEGAAPVVLAASADLLAAGTAVPSAGFPATDERAAEPLWTSEGLLRTPPCHLGALASAEHAGAPVWDPSTSEWYASANGVLVRVEGTDRLIAVHEAVRGHDLDVRAARGLVVSREPGDVILLQRFGDAGKAKRALLVGQAFFGPRLSASGHAVAVSESRAEGPRVRVMDTTTAKVLAVLEGSNPAWHPSGSRIVLTRTRHDGKRILDASLVEANLQSGRERALLLPSEHAPTRAAVSPGGDSIAYVDARSGAIHVAPYKAEGR